MVETIVRDMKPADRASFSPDDALFLLEWPMLRLAAAAIRESHWGRIAMSIERLKVWLGKPSPTRIAPTIQQSLALADSKEAEAIGWRAAAFRTEHYIQIMKVISAKGWAPTIRVEGEEHLKAALTRGKGAILWVAHFCFNTQVTKMALRELGYRVSHISRPEHGFSKSQFGIRYLNPMRWAAEAKYLDERIIIDRTRPGNSLLRAKAVVEDNRIVSITAGTWEGRRVTRGRLLGGYFMLATGAPELAHGTGASLLPVITVRITDTAVFRVKIGEPLTAKFDDKNEWIRAATARFLAELEAAVREFPDQWRGWKYVEHPASGHG
jgi:lauroyl/myristoyl acyltransferase